MANPLPVINPSHLGEDQHKGRSAKEKVRNTLTDELVFGICAPIGSMRQPVIDELFRILKEEYKYEVQIIKLSTYIEKHKEVKNNNKL